MLFYWTQKNAGKKRRSGSNGLGLSLLQLERIVQHRVYEVFWHETLELKNIMCILCKARQFLSSFQRYPDRCVHIHAVSFGSMKSVLLLYAPHYMQIQRTIGPKCAVYDEYIMWNWIMSMLSDSYLQSIENIKKEAGHCANDMDSYFRSSNIHWNGSKAIIRKVNCRLNTTKWIHQLVNGISIATSEHTRNSSSFHWWCYLLLLMYFSHRFSIRCLHSPEFLFWYRSDSATCLNLKWIIL